MANYCKSEYRVEGKKETLQKIMEVINSTYKEIGEQHFDMETIFERLGIPTENFEFLGDWRDANMIEADGQSVLAFVEYYKWIASMNMEQVAALPAYKDDITAVYRYSEDEAGDIFEVSDPEGKYFPERFRTGCRDKQNEIVDEKCMDEQAVIALFRQYYPEVKAEITLEELVQQYGYENNKTVRFWYAPIVKASGISAKVARKVAEEWVKQYFAQQDNKNE